MDLNTIAYFNKEMTKEHLEKLRNGRVDMNGNSRDVNNFPLYETSNSGNTLYKSEALKSIKSTDSVKSSFFSDDNMEKLLNLIKYKVWKNSNKVYNDELLSRLNYLMTSIYKDNTTLEDLNDTVVREYLVYLRNGPVDVSENKDQKNKFPLYEEVDSGNSNYKAEALKSILTHYDEPLHNVYFSQKNIDLIQNMIIHKVWKTSESRYVIGRQSDRELKLIMRSIFLQHGNYNKINIRQQIIKLNNLVYVYCVPNILSNLQQFITYKRDVNYLPVPLQHPINLSIKGSKY